MQRCFYFKIAFLGKLTVRLKLKCPLNLLVVALLLFDLDLLFGTASQP